MTESGVPDRATSPLTGLLERSVGKPHDRESRQTGRNVDLDADDPTVEADDRGRQDGGQHRPTLAVGTHHGLHHRSPVAYPENVYREEAGCRTSCFVPAAAAAAAGALS